MVLLCWLSLVPILSAAVAAGPPAGVLAAMCPYTKHYYASSGSGYGTIKGTGASAQTWTSWSLSNHSDGFANEAVWASNNNNSNNALEVGFSTGGVRPTFVRWG
jgi:hypothetical protein